MRTIDKKTGKRVIYPLLFIILSAIVIFNIIRITDDSSSNKVVVYRIESGWGYRILQGDHVAVEQPFIPLLPGRTPFPSRYAAKRTGTLVLERLEKGVVPVITFQDLEKLGLVK